MNNQLASTMASLLAPFLAPFFGAVHFDWVKERDIEKDLLKASFGKSSHRIPNSQKMESGRDKLSLKGSQTNVGESIQPLLESDPSKGAAELQRGASTKDIPEAEEHHRLALNCIDSFTMSMNLLDRDSGHINDHINVVFEEVLAEPRTNHSFDQVWRFAYVLFAGTKLWVYRVVAAAFAVPCGLLWGLLFSLLAVASVWIITPAMKLVDVLLQVIVRVWGGLVRAVLDPVFQSASLLIRGKQENAPLQESI